MSINLLDLMRGAVSNKIVGQVSGLLGVDEASVNKLVGGALPSLLAGFIGKASTPEGAEQLGAVLDQADGTIVDNVDKILGGADGGSERLMEMGKGLIGGLFGDKVDGLLDLLSGVSGLDKEKSGSLMGLIAPIIFSLLGKQKKALGLDASGFAKLLLSQKDLIKGVLPPGLSGVLGLSGFDGDDNVAVAAENLKDAVVNAASNKLEETKEAADSVLDAAAEKTEETKEELSAAISSATGKLDDTKEAAAAAADKTAAAAAAAASSVSAKIDDAKDAVSSQVSAATDSSKKVAETTASSGGGFVKLLVPIIILAVLGVLIWKVVLPKLGGESSAAAPVSIKDVGPDNAVAAMNKVISQTKSTLKGIKDVESAKAAVPKIEGMSRQVNSVIGKVGTLPEPVQNQLRKAVVDFAPQFNDLVERAYGIPGVQAILEPKIDELVSKLENFG